MKHDTSSRRGRMALAATLLASLLALPLLADDAMERDYDDCDANFIAFLGADAYQFSPLHKENLGQVRLHTILSFQKVAALADYGRVAWRVEIRGPVGTGSRTPLVRAAEGEGRIESAGQLIAEYLWDGRDGKGNLVAEGKYRYTFLARFVADSAVPLASGPISYEGLGKVAESIDAYASVDELIVSYKLAETEAAALRESLNATLCQLQQNNPLESGFGYNFYYGSTHSHSNWSDGGYPTSACSSGNTYGSGTLDPAGVFNFAKNTAGLDYWVVNEHNHLIEDAIKTNNAPLTEAKVKARYAAGLAAASSATVNGSFVGLYGMEWGVSSNTDQGHVTFLETPKLFGWETCSTCNGPNPECTPGTNCYFDVFTPKRYGYLTAYKRSVENPSAAGPLGIFCHPGAGNFDNYAFNADADAAMQGIAVRSGLAFNTAADCANANVASTDYSARWREALNKGFHLGPVADHDVHCNNYGVGLPNRTVYLLPNGSSPALTKTAMLQAHKARHFFASEDSNAQLVFTSTTPSGHIMGDIFSASGTATLRAAVYDPNGESVSTLEIWRGQIGGGVPASARATVSGSSTLTITDNFTSGTYYYYVHAVQADGHDLWSAPMWITYGSGGGGGGTPLNIGGYKLTQANSTANYTIPTGTTIPANGYVVIGRSATKSAFEAFWGTLPAGVVYLNSGGLMPVINGSETYTLKNASGTTIDGATVAMPSAALKTLQRINPCTAANVASNWNTLATTSANPGSGAGTGCAKGLVINEFADASGSGNYVYEFLELHWDQ